MTTDHIADRVDARPERGRTGTGASEAMAHTQGVVAPDTHPLELERLARERAQHAECDPLAVQVLVWLVRAATAVLDNQAENLRDVGLSTSGFNVLMALRNSPGQVLEPCDIAERLLVSRPSVTGLLDTLESRGLIERRSHPHDGRRRLVHLTAAARDLLAGNLSVHYREIDRLLADLSREEQVHLVTLLRRVDGATPAALR